MSFLHAGLLFGALLFTVPLIIHLLNRQRYKRRDWAAMEFLLRAYKKNRRRLRTENLLLLLLRCLIPIILALAVARPLLTGGAALGLDGSTHHVLVLDQSYSMGLQPDGDTSPYQRMKAEAARLLERIDSNGPDKVSLVLAGVRTSIPVRQDLNLARAKAELAKLGSPPDSATDLTDALTQTAELVEESADPDTRVYLFTDLQLHAFGPDPFERSEDLARTAADGGRTTGRGGTAADDQGQDGADQAMFEDTARDLFGRISDAATLSVVDTGGIALDSGVATQDNLLVTEVRLAKPLAIARDPTTVWVTVENRSSTAREVQVTLEKDGGEPSRKMLKLDAGATNQVDFRMTFLTTGSHRLHASVSGDGLDADNHRYRVVNVRDRIRLLLVEGSDEDDARLTETELARLILDPTGGEGNPELLEFAPTVMPYVDFLAGSARLDAFDIVVLANVRELNGVIAKDLRDAVANGTGLMLWLGDRVDAGSYNLHLHDAGAGPLPLTLLRAAGFRPGGDQFYGSRIAIEDHPLLGGFVEPRHRRQLQDVGVYRYWVGELAEPAAEASATATDETTTAGSGTDSAATRAAPPRVVLRVEDPELSPLLVTSTFGEGKVLTLCTNLNERPDRWNDWQQLFISLPLLHETARWLALPSQDPFNATVGAELTALLPFRPRDVTVVLPERAGGAKTLVPEGPEQPVRRGRYALPPFRRTEFAGIYVAETRRERDVNGSGEPIYFAVNPDIEEGQLEYLAHDLAIDRLGLPRILRSLPTEGLADVPAGRSDLGIPFLWLALGLLLGEATLARMVSRRRSG